MRGVCRYFIYPCCRCSTDELTFDQESLQGALEVQVVGLAGLARLDLGRVVRVVEGIANGKDKVLKISLLNETACKQLVPIIDRVKVFVAPGSHIRDVVTRLELPPVEL